MLIALKMYLFINGISQRDLAEALDVSDGFISLVIKGQRLMPKRRAEVAKHRFNIPVDLWYSKAA